MILNDYKAIDFFECLETGETKHLKIKDHKEVFIELYDAYFEARNDQKGLAKIRSVVKIEALKHKLAFLDYAYTIIDEIPLNAKHILDVQNALEQTGLQIDLSKPKKALAKIKRTINTTKNLIEISKGQENEKEVKFDFTGVLVSFENVMGFPIPENVSIAKFLAYEKKLIDKINQQKKK